MDLRTQLQLEEALGSLNRWYCSQAYHRRIDDPEVLVCYFIRSGGAADFADRYKRAMGAMNRWYCSEFYGREICDEEVLWNYYMEHHGSDTQARRNSSCRVVSNR